MSLDASDVMDEIAVVGVEQLAETQAAECTAIRSILMSRRSRSGNQRCARSVIASMMRASAALIGLGLIACTSNGGGPCCCMRDPHSVRHGLAFAGPAWIDLGLAGLLQLCAHAA
jgi:hypothetical protein